MGLARVWALAASPIATREAPSPSALSSRGDVFLENAFHPEIRSKCRLVLLFCTEKFLISTAKINGALCAQARSARAWALAASPIAIEAPSPSSLSSRGDALLEHAFLEHISSMSSAGRESAGRGSRESGGRGERASGGGSPAYGELSRARRADSVLGRLPSSPN